MKTRILYEKVIINIGDCKRFKEKNLDKNMMWKSDVQSSHFIIAVMFFSLRDRHFPDNLLFGGNLEMIYLSDANLSFGKSLTWEEKSRPSLQRRMAKERRRSKAEYMTSMYWCSPTRSCFQLFLKPIRTMLGLSLPRPARVMQALEPPTKSGVWWGMS